MLTARRKLHTVFISLLLLAFGLGGCLTADEPMVLSGDGEAIEEGTLAEPTPGEEPAVEVEEADVAELATGEATDAPDEEAAEATEVPEEEAAEESTTDEGVAAEIGFTDVLVSAGYFINLDVENENGDVIADVDDVLLDLNSGQILYVIVNYGDFLDLTTEDRPIPLTALGWNEELELVLKVPEEMLESVPAVEDEWPAVDDAAWNDAALTFWQDTEFAAEFDAEAAPVRISTLIGLHAGQLGTDLGVVEDMLLDLNNQRVAYMGIYTTDDFYSPDLVLLVPLAAADLSAEVVGDELTYAIALLEVDPEVLQAAPALDRAIFNTADFIDQSFTQELNTYWSEQGIDVGASE
jgi:sporulation protein YlmC with PRC-barrel domain